MNNLDGKVVVVTGAARRIGRSIALELAASGAKVAVHYWTSEAEARDTAEQCGGRVFQADLTDVAAIERLFAAVRDTYGRLDGLVNNAARYRAMDVLRVTEQDWDALHNVNLKATFFCCQQAAKIMLESGGGRIVNISSIWSKIAKAERGPYAASKFALDGMTAALAAEVAESGILANCVGPGFIDTEMTRAALGEKGMKELAQQVPVRRMGRPEEIAAFVAWLAGPENTFISGQNIAIDGGFTRV